MQKINASHATGINPNILSRNKEKIEVEVEVEVEVDVYLDRGEYNLASHG